MSSPVLVVTPKQSVDEGALIARGAVVVGSAFVFVAPTPQAQRFGRTAIGLRSALFVRHTASPRCAVRARSARGEDARSSACFPTTVAGRTPTTVFVRSAWCLHAFAPRSPLVVHHRRISVADLVSKAVLIVGACPNLARAQSIAAAPTRRTGGRANTIFGAVLAGDVGSAFGNRHIAGGQRARCSAGRFV